MMMSPWGWQQQMGTLPSAAGIVFFSGTHDRAAL
jgi:hypothetical protein